MEAKSTLWAEPGPDTFDTEEDRGQLAAVLESIVCSCCSVSHQATRLAPT
jgi:hypothetical protein